MNDAEALVVTLDDSTVPTGSMPKLAAHRAPGQPHLAFSVLLAAPDGRVLLQRRAAGKHHFAGAWANTCCSHPRPGEAVPAAAQRRLFEELGIGAPVVLTPWAGFWYQALDPVSGFVEVEYDVVLLGQVEPSVPLDPDPREVDDLAWVTPDEARRIAQEHGTGVAPWLDGVLARAACPRRAIPASVPLTPSDAGDES